MLNDIKYLLFVVDENGIKATLYFNMFCNIITATNSSRFEINGDKTGPLVLKCDSPLVDVGVMTGATEDWLQIVCIIFRLEEAFQHAPEPLLNTHSKT